MHRLTGISLPEVVLGLILARFIVYVVSAMSWTPVSFHLAWMSAVVAWGLASSSCTSNLWIE